MLGNLTTKNGVPFGQIDYNMANPKHISDIGEYKDVNGELAIMTWYIERGGYNILLEGDKGTGKTMMVHHICKKYGKPLFEVSCGNGMNKGDLIGRPQINESGSYFELGYLPMMFELANHWKELVCYFDEPNVLEHDQQKWFNRPLDKRRSIYANGKLFKLDDGVKLTVIGTMNPVSYAGVNTLTEDLRSRFIGRIVSYPSRSQLENIIDWKMPDHIKNNILTLCEDIQGLRVKNEVEYVLSPRDVDQFNSLYKAFNSAWALASCKSINSLDDVLRETLNNCVLIKFDDPTEREHVRLRIEEIFGVRV